MRLSIVSICLVLSACATPQRQIAGKIGCPPDEVRIVEADSMLGLTDPVLRVQCYDQEFICSGRAGASILDEMSCAKAVRHAGPAARAAYLTHEDLQQERNFEEFLEELSEPPAKR
jgi:hypothetical protein